MDLDETETYSAAALFTLALYSSQVEVGVDRFHETSLGEFRAAAWGCPPELDLDEVMQGEGVQAENLKHFWGWDCCGVNGLCQSIYRNLSIPEKSWMGLMKVPETVGDVSTDAGIEELIQIVEHYSRMLDPELRYSKGKAVEIFSAQRQRSIDVGELDVVAAGGGHASEDAHSKRCDSTPQKLQGIVEDSTSDDAPLLEEQQPPDATPVPQETPEGTIGAPPKAKQSVFADAVPLDCPEAAPEEIGGSDSDGDAAYEMYVQSLQQHEVECAVEETEDVVIPKAGFTPRNDYRHHASGKSCLALRAMIHASLVESALAPKDDKEEGAANIDVCIQWYDARSRIALMRMAHWLRIPWSTMSAFEVEAAFSYLRLKDDTEVNKKSTAVSRWLKVSAMAIGGGAAVAFTGGLAAPAVAAGLGAAVTLAGGGAAAASAVTGFAASAAGTATITTAFGAFGAHSTGSTMYKRTTDIKEFAFWDLSMDWTTELEKKQARTSVQASSKFWTWGRRRANGNPDSASSQGKRSLSMSQLPSPDQLDSSPAAEMDGYVALGDSPTEPDSPTESIQGDALIHTPKKKTVEVVPGVEVDLDDLEVTKSTSNYTEWWEGLRRAKERPDLLPVPVNVRGGDHSTMAVTIAVSGVINNDKHFIDPWKRLPGVSCDRFAVIWETDLLKKVSDALVGLITSQVANEAAKWFIKKYLYTGLLSAVAIPVLITTVFDVTVGNNWALAMDRSLKAGELLAQYFIQGLHGHRPVTLIGYSLGARCIFRCLLTLYDAGMRGVVENVILLGAPVSLTDYKWARARSVVAGRFVNGYSSRDWVLGIIFRIGRGVLQNVAGISPVGVPGVENVDLSAIVSGQTEYACRMKDILAALNL